MPYTGRQVPEALQARFDETVAQAQGRAVEIGEALFGFAGLLDSSPSVRRAVTDTGRSGEDREALVRQLVGGRIDDATTDLLAAAVHERWSRASALTAAVEEFGVLAYLTAARAHDRLEAVEDEVFRFGQVVHAEPALRTALLDRSAPTDARRQLVRRLLEGKAAPETVQLVEHAVLDRRDRSIEADLDRITEFAAQLRQRRLAVVRVAAPLSQDHRDRLERALAAQAGGPVQLNVVVEPGLVGGIKVEIGDDVVDGTVVSRLQAARRQFALDR